MHGGAWFPSEARVGLEKMGLSTKTGLDVLSIVAVPAASVDKFLKGELLFLPNPSSVIYSSTPCNPHHRVASPSSILEPLLALATHRQRVGGHILSQTHIRHWLAC